MIGAFPYQSIAIISNSMNPSIERGDVLIYKKLKNYKNLSPGTIIVFKKENKNYVHRIKNRIESTTTYYETKGDANPQIDQYLVPEKNILGICIFKIKYIGYPSIWLYEFFES